MFPCCARMSGIASCTTPCVTLGRTNWDGPLRDLRAKAEADDPVTDDSHQGAKKTGPYSNFRCEHYSRTARTTSVASSCQRLPLWHPGREVVRPNWFDPATRRVL